MPSLSPHSAFVAYLRANGPAAVDWGPDKSPYYEEPPEPTQKFPFVVYEIGKSTKEDQFEGVYIERFPIAVHVICLQADVEALTSPTIGGSVFNVLDALQLAPAGLNGQGFECQEFSRGGYELHFDRALRAPDGSRAYVASADYEAKFNMGV